MNDALKEYSQSIYAMGNPHKLTETECKDINLATEIVLKIKFYQSTVKDSIDTQRLIGRLRKSKFNFDLKPFIKRKRKGDDKKYESEICKIIYFFFALEYVLIPELLGNERKYFDVIEFLSNPSMESIDYSHLGLGSEGPKTYSGAIIRIIKNTLEKEMSPQTIENTTETFRQIASAWEEPLKCANIGMDLGIELDYDQVIRAFDSVLDKPHKALEGNTYQASAIETLYLKVKQHEYKGLFADILVVNRQAQTDMDFDVPPELLGIFGLSVPSVPSTYVSLMRIMYKQAIVTDNLERYVKEYIDDYADGIAHLVFLEPNPDKEDRQKLRENTGKVLTVLDYCIRARPLIIMGNEFTTLFIISCLQAILTDKRNQIFDYDFYLYQYLTGKHYKPRVQAALKNDEYTVNALKVYWARKVADHIFANIGRDELKVTLREFENKRAEILMQIYSCPSVSDMLSVHEYYYEKIKQSLLCYT